MNCEHAGNLLTDLVYDEISPADRQALEAHLAGCEACRAELDSLQLARSLLARGRAGEPANTPAVPDEDKGVARAERAALRLPSRWRWRRLSATALAACLLIGLGVAFLMYGPVEQPVRADVLGPVEIKQLGVSLTILSQPDDWPGPFHWSDSQANNALTQQRAVYPNAAPYLANVQRAEVQVLAPAQYYQIGGRRGYRHGWPGYALVRDQRMVRNLKKGQTTVRLTGVPSGILPDSVRLRGAAGADGLTILEQNYQYDLASAWAVLKRYTDKEIRVVLKNREAASGRLLSFDPHTLVIQPAGQGPRSVSYDQVRAVQFEKLPEGLLTRPTLVWDLDNRAAAQQQFEVAYLTHGLNWRADYVLKLRLAEGRPKGDKAKITDTADIVGYATVMNHSGVTYEQAQLKLLAGDVNLIRPARPPDDPHVDEFYAYGGKQDGKGLGFKEKSFFEYHLYTLGRPATIRHAETKQIELLTAGGVKMQRGYVYDRNRHASAVQVVHEFENTEANGLGKPLPKGVVRLYAPDPEGIDTFAGKTSIDHTPVKETVRVPWGYAFDIVGSFKQTNYRRQGNARHYTSLYEIRNHKTHAVTVTVIVRVPKSTYAAECKRPWHIREVGVIEIPVTLQPDSIRKVEFSYSYNPYSGGGLTSPHDVKDT